MRGILVTTFIIVIFAALSREYSGFDFTKSAETPEQKKEREGTEARQRARKKEEERTRRDLAAIKSFRASMENPATFRLDQALRMSDGALCLGYRATNSLNVVTPGYAVLTKTSLVVSDDPSFHYWWALKCAGSGGRDDANYLRVAVGSL